MVPKSDIEGAAKRMMDTFYARDRGLLDGEDVEVLLFALQLLDRHSENELMLARKEANRTKEIAVVSVRKMMISARNKLELIRRSHKPADRA